MDKKLFDDVLYVGPDINAPGGIASVLKMYKKHLPSFHYVASNSRYGTVVGLMILLMALMKILWHRWIYKRRILHVHAASGKSFIRKSIIIYWGSLLGYKIIFHNHAGDFIEYSNRLGIDKVKRILSLTSCTVALAPLFVDFFRTDLGQQRVRLIHNMIEPPQRVIPKRIDGVFNMLFLGLISENKGIFELVRAVYECSKSSDVRLWIGGKGDDDRLHNLIDELNLNEKCITVGWISGEEKLKLLAGCNVFILPSHFECLPMSILEAMTYGKPIIATNVGGISYMVHDGINGSLIAPEDHDALVDVIKKYIQNPSIIESMGLESEKIAAKFFPDVVITQLEEMYVKIMSKS